METILLQIITVILPLRPTSSQTVIASFNPRHNVATRSALSPLHSPVTPQFQVALNIVMKAPPQWFLIGARSAFTI